MKEDERLKLVNHPIFKEWNKRIVKDNPEYIKLQQEKDKLQNNWNELKKWLEEEYKYIPHTYCRMFQKILNKMQELEQGKDE